MKAENTRCPLQAECERKCKFVNHELECDYYHANARPGYEIADQEEKRWSTNKMTFDYDDDPDDEELDTEDPAEEEDLPAKPINGLMCKIPVDKLVPHPDNPRKQLGDLTELAASIEAKGILQNLTVVEAEDDTYRIIIGHRRHAAAKLAGLTKLPCVIVDMTPREQFETMMIENIQRSDLTVYEEAEGFQMMLDMGGSVEEVADKTGFSETTVRNRVKLLKLDKKEFQKAEKRGATMTDYLKLNAIEDPERRNDVLKTIGTADFNNSLKNAIADEAFQARMDRVRNYFRNEQDWAREKTDESCYGSGEYSYYTAYDKYHEDDPVKPDDAGTVDYLYSFNGTNGVTIYRKNEKKVDPVSELKAQLKEKLAGITGNLKRISQTHLEMREEFILDFSATATYEMDIASFAAKAIVHAGGVGYYGRSIDLDRLGNMIKVPVVGENGQRDLDPEAWRRILFNRPQYALLCTAYTLLEKEGQNYYHWVWEQFSGGKPEHIRNTSLDIIYDGLNSMGYDMSEEEIQMYEGTHPLFQKAVDLIVECEKKVAEYEEAKKNEQG